MIGRALRRTEAGALVDRRDGDADHALDIAQESCFLVIAERNCDAVGAGARGAADAVDIRFRNVRQVVVDHMADAVDVDAAGSDVGGDEDTQLAVTEVGEHALALVLRLVAVDRLGAEAGLLQMADDLVGAMLGACEHQHAVGGLGLERFDQQIVLGRLLSQDDALRDAVNGRGLRRHGDALRVCQHRVGQLGDLARHCGREEQGLPLLAQHRDNLPDVVDEAHVEHAVGFVEDEDFDLVERDRALVHEIEQTARRGDENFDAMREAADLPVDRHAADSQFDRQRFHVPAIGAK